MPETKTVRNMGNWSTSFRFSRWILAEMCLQYKCFILVTNFQKLPSAGGSPPPAPLNLQFWWPKIAWFYQIVFFFELIVSKSNLKKSVMTSFQWRYRKTSPKLKCKIFLFRASL